ncbi:hypothetical protein [Streptomyces sp. NPDC059063]|uniref:hypothetical protein n=1 Tax=unclassified Streptomyces TaxID=2593676 RepID=UPI0036BA6D7A
MATHEELRRQYEEAARTVRQCRQPVREGPALPQVEQRAEEAQTALDRVGREASEHAAAQWEQAHPMPALPRVPWWAPWRRKRTGDERRRLRGEYESAPARQRFLAAADAAAREAVRTAYRERDGADIDALARTAHKAHRAFDKRQSERARACAAAGQETRTAAQALYGGRGGGGEGNGCGGGNGGGSNGG